MKKQQVRNLQDQFSNLFLNQQPQQSLSYNNQSNLLDSHDHSENYNSPTFKQAPLAESQGDDQDFLDRVDDILGQDQQNDENTTRREIMLNFKINELQMACKKLKSSNLKLIQRVQQLQSNNLQAQDNSISINKSQDLTIMQENFCQIEEEISNYRQQLEKYQENMLFQLSKKNDQIFKLKNDLRNLRETAQQFEKEINQKSRIISLLQQKNEQLLISLQDISNEKQKQEYENGYNSQGKNWKSRINNSFNDKIQTQMENMIDRLLKELKYEKKNSHKQISEIKRLNTQIFDLEGKIKEKNNKIYQLQMSIIMSNKQNQKKHTNQAKNQHQHHNQNQHYKNEHPQQPLSPYIPHNSQIARQNYFQNNQEQQSNKRRQQMNSKSFNKNRVIAERERQAGFYNNNNNKVSQDILKLNKVFSTFTLMDLLNKEFKIRVIEKYIIACKIVEVYAKKLIQENYENLISEEIEIYNFNSQSPDQIRVRVNILHKNDTYQTNEENMLYNMAFILDTLINQVQVVDSYLSNNFELNIPQYIQQIMTKDVRQQKYGLLLQLSKNIQQLYMN